MLTTLRSILCCSMLVPGVCFCQPAAQDSAGQDASKDREALILRLTHEVLDAELRNDRVAMNRLFTDNYTHTHQSGVFQNKAEFIAMFMPGTQKYTIAEISDVQVRHFGTSAIVNGHENINNHHYLFSCFWVLDKDKWRMAAWITSPASKTAAAAERRN